MHGWEEGKKGKLFERIAARVGVLYFRGWTRWKETEKTDLSDHLGAPVEHAHSVCNHQDREHYQDDACNAGYVGELDALGHAAAATRRGESEKSTFTTSVS